MIKILIADDHFIVRKGLRQLLLEEFNTVEIEEAEDAETLLSKLRKSEWDLLICDINMPGRSGLDALKQIKISFPAMPVLILSMHNAEQYAIRVLRTGASGYLNKSSIGEELLIAVKRLLSGKKYFSQSVMEILACSIGKDFGKQAHDSLSSREFDVMKYLAAGKSIADIAVMLSLGVTTISTYRYRVMAKIGLRTNSDLTKYAMDNQLLEY